MHYFVKTHKFLGGNCGFKQYKTFLNFLRQNRLNELYNIRFIDKFVLIRQTCIKPGRIKMNDVPIT